MRSGTIMGPWPKHPLIYEINTWVWLDELAQRYQRPMSLGMVPDEVWDALASLGFDAVWLMGVWERSPAGLEVSRRDAALAAEFRRTLADFSDRDNVGSPYCVRRYVVDAHFGGPEELAAARHALAERGLRLMLDFVPNHVARDHPWVTTHPEYFIQGDNEDLGNDPEAFALVANTVFACGRDPYFPPWRDVLQLNAFHPGLRQAAVETLLEIAGQCDGVRCDMAMLLMTPVFARTWGQRIGEIPSTEYWPDLISAARAQYPDFIFMAESYWDLEWDLQQEGFDYCYDKRLYDRLVRDHAVSVRLHLLADSAYQNRLVRFLENHDEPRAAATFEPARERAAAVIMTTLPGAKLFYEGQLEGRRNRVPVFLRRRPVEPLDASLRSFYYWLLSVVSDPSLRGGTWRLCERSGWPDNPSFLTLLAWCWAGAEDHYLIVVNYGDARAQGQIPVPWEGIRNRSWQLHDRYTGTVYQRDGTQMYYPGLYVDLSPWDFHFFKIEGC